MRIDATTFPSAVILPPNIIIFPMFADIAVISFVTTLPSNKITFPIFPTDATIPLSNKITFPMLPEVAMTCSTLAYVPITLPLMSMLATDGSVAVTPSNNAPLPK